MSKIKLTGESSGYVEISAGNAAGNNTLEAPTSGTRLVAHEGSQDVTLNGNLTVNGVLSYEDITNIDSVGIVTARSGIHVTGGSVGLGIDNPTAPLHISGADSTNAKIKIEDNNNGFAASEINIANGGRDLRIAAPQDIYFQDVDTGEKHLYIESGGNIGIGTDNPGAKTHIDSTTSNTPLVVEASQNNRSRIVFRNNVETGTECNIELFNDDLRFVTNSGERLRIDSAGSVIIGDSDTDNANAIANDLVVGNTSQRSGITIVSGSGDDGNIFFSNGTGLAALRGQIVYNHTGDRFSFYTAAAERLRITSTGKCEVYKGTSTTGKTSGSEAFTVGNGANNKRFSVYPDGSTVIGGQGTIGDYNILLQNDGQSYFGARMKIGTTTEGEANADDLTVATSGHTGMTIRSGTANRGNIYFSDGTSGDAEYRGYVTYDHDGDKLKFGTANYDRLIIKSDGKAYFTGNLGLDGQTSPGAAIHINNYGNSGYELRLTGNALQFNRTSSSYIDQLNDTGSILFRMGSSYTEAMRITSDGNIGIGLAGSNPDARLHVEENLSHSSTYYLNADAHILVDNSGSGKSVLKLEGDAALVYGGGGSPLLVADRQYERLRINEHGNTIFQGALSPSNGNTGNAAILVRGKTVSGSSTTVDLNISQSYSTNGVGLEIQESSNSANALATLVFNHGSLKSMIACSRVATNNWGTDLRFYTHPTSTNSANQHKVYERLRITEGGNVGINDTSPSKLLTVNRGTSDGDLGDLKNDEVSLRFGVWGAGSTYPRQCTINATRQDGGAYPWLRLAGQDGIHFCSDLNNIRGNLNAYGEWRLGVANGNLISTDQSHTIGNIGVYNTTNAARLQMQERTGIWISFKNGSGVHYGSISQNSPGVLYGSNSDYRLKDNVQNFTNGIELVKRLRPVTFNWNVLSGQEDTTTTQRGFLAHEVQEIEPGAVDGVKDEMDRVGDCTNAEGVVTQKNVYESQAKDGETWTLVSEEIKDQQLDPAKLVPILTAALKEAIGKIETLEAKVAVLEGS